jgi:chemotaxis protein histidine kinase CheA
MLSLFTAILATLRRHALLFLFLLTAAALAFLAHDWLAQHDARLKLESTLAAQQKIVTDADQRQSARDAQLTQSLSQIAALKKSVQTPQQSAAAINQALSQLVATSSNGQPLPAPIEIDLPTAPAIATSPANSDSVLTNLKSQISNLKSPSGIPSPQGTATQQGSSQQGSAPQGTSASAKLVPQASVPAHSNHDASASPQSTAPPPAILRIPQNDLKPLFDTIEDCQSCRAQLTNAQADLTDERTKSAALTAQRDAALKSAHGTLWTRIRHNAKWFIIGAAAGALLSRAH